MRVEDNRKYRLHDLKPKAASSIYSNSRSVFLRQKLPNGRYVCIPSTFDPQFEGKFLLRIYSDETNGLKELVKDCPEPCCLRMNPFTKYAKCVTSLIVKSASSKLQNDSNGPLDTYVKIICEGKSVTGKVVKNSMIPEWETSAIFYRYKQKSPILIEIWISKSFRDEKYASITLDATPNNKHVILQSSLDTNNDNERKSGIVTIDLQSMTSITAI